MAYVSPTITPSGTTFAQLQAGGFRGQMIRLARVNALPDELRTTFEFQPGQHIAIVSDAAGDEVRRLYSICSPVGGPLRVAVKQLPEGRFSRYACSELKPGDTLEVMPPVGRFTTAVEPARARHYAAIAAGSDTPAALERAGIEPGEGLAALAELELGGYVRRELGGRFSVLP